MRDHQLFTFEQKIRNAKVNRLISDQLINNIYVDCDIAEFSLESAVATQRCQKDHLNDKMILSDKLYDEVTSSAQHQKEIQEDFVIIASNARSKHKRLIN